MIRKNGILYWRIPNGIELSTSLNLFPPRIRKKKLKVDVFYFILDEITKRTFRSSMDQQENYIEIHSNVFLRFHHDYKDYMDYLIFHKIIERDEEFIVDEKCFGYRINLNEINFENPFQEIPIKDELIRSKLESDAYFKEIFSDAQSDYSHLTKWFNSSLKIDDKRAIKKIKQLYELTINDGLLTKNKRNEALNKLLKNLCVIDEIKHHDFYCEVDYNIGRFHSNLTNLKKELRPFITYEGRKLVNIDIRNSQPLLSTVLFNLWFWDKNTTKLSIYKIPTAMNIMLGYKIDKQQVKEYGMRWYTGIERIRNKVEGNILSVTFFLKSLNREHMEYISFCFSSKFYKKVWDKVFPGRQFDKPKAKKIFYQYIYSSNSGYQWEDKVSISQAFPTVSDFFHLLKHPDYVLLSHIMQRLESIVMIEVVSRRIAAEKPGIPIFTIHDSIATLPEEVDYIKQVIKEEFKRYLDLNVKLGRENWY